MKGSMRAVRGRTDKILLLAVTLIAFLGVFFLYSATWDRDASGGGVHPLVVKQCIWVLAGLAMMILISGVDYHKMVDVAYITYALSLVALVYLLIFAGERYGARRWIGLGPVTLQPSELVKLTVILALAAFLGERREKIGTLRNYIGLSLFFPRLCSYFFSRILAPHLFWCRYSSQCFLSAAKGSNIF